MTRRGARSVVVVGTGSLARATCYGLAVLGGEPLDVVVVGRDRSRATETSDIAAVRAALAGSTTSFRPVAPVALDDRRSLTELFRALAPDGVLLCASVQSPWERYRAPSAWTDLLGRAGFGLTMPLHATLAVSVGRAVASGHPPAWFVNACFPDAVNAVLHAHDVPVLCGVGNGATVAAVLQARLGLTDQRRLTVLAHHVHLSPPARSDEEACAWYDDRPVAAVTDLLTPLRSADRRELNQITGHTAASLVRHLAFGGSLATHLPGPLGLPGGYPVFLEDTRITLRLPHDVSEQQAVAYNQDAAFRDGVVVAEGEITFTGRTRRALEQVEPALVASRPTSSVLTTAHDIGVIRDRLRQDRPSHKEW